MRAGQTVRLQTDDWASVGQVGRVIDEWAVNGANRCRVAVNGDVLICSSAELEPVTRDEEPALRH